MKVFKYTTYENYLRNAGNQQRLRDHRKPVWHRVLSKIGCRKCGLRDHRFLEWNHIIPSDKKVDVANLYGRPFRVVCAEARKCEVLCSACHKEETRMQSAQGLIAYTRKPLLTREEWEAGRAEYAKTLKYTHKKPRRRR